MRAIGSVYLSGLRSVPHTTGPGLQGRSDITKAAASWSKTGTSLEVFVAFLRLGLTSLLGHLSPPELPSHDVDST